MSMLMILWVCVAVVAAENLGIQEKAHQSDTVKELAVCGVDEFQCCNDNCVPLTDGNNTFNDCGDNSDEVTVECCSKQGDFHCLEGGCVPITYYLDGFEDCVDGSDEAKHIGLGCSASLGPEACCQCEVYVNNSECRDEGDGLKCHCAPGYYEDVTTLRECIRRQLGDPCEEDSDCSSVMDNTICHQPGLTCGCRDGWYIDGDSCLRRQLGSPCEEDSDCYRAINHTVCRPPALTCDCQDWWYPENNICVRRVGFVAFRALRMTALGEGHIDFETTDYNYESAFDPATSTFTSPVNGVYVFDVLFGNAVHSGIHVTINGVNDIYFRSFDDTHETLSSSHQLHLLEGDTVSLTMVRIGSTSTLGCGDYRSMCIFSGRLIHQDI